MALSFLVVDDSETMRRIIRKTLRLTPVEIDTIHEAATGMQALDILRHYPIHLVLSNITMPELNGIEMLKVMQSEETMQHIPVIILSSAGQQAHYEPLLAGRVNGQLRKPFAREILRDLILKVLGDADEA